MIRLRRNICDQAAAASFFLLGLEKTKKCPPLFLVRVFFAQQILKGENAAAAAISHQWCHAINMIHIFMIFVGGTNF